MEKTQENQVKTAVYDILTAIGEDPQRDGLQRTPERVTEMYEEIFAGYDADPVKLLTQSLFDVKYDAMILVKDIEFYSMCEHHMLPFYGRVHVAYVPKNKIVGLSQIPRLVEMFARRLQVQERMTQQIAETLYNVLQPQGVGVIVEGSHLCAMMRGVEKEQMRMVTSAMRGTFKRLSATRNEFLTLLKE
jgi:GTP cyclohydrolase I